MYYYLIVFALLFVAELIYFKIANSYNIIDKPNERSSHTRITLRGGGVIFYFGALAYFLTNDLGYPWFMLGLTLITAISFVDDVRPVSQKIRLVFHFTAMAVMFWQWGLTDLPWWYMLVALIVCTGIINAYNFMDGINGITGGYSLVLLCALAYINASIVPFVEAKLIYTSIAAVLVFNFFNFRKRAKCFAGDVGAVSIAFIVLFALARLILVTGDWTYLFFLAVYGADSIMTIVHRIYLRENIFLPHRKHVYQLMANELHIPHTVVSSIYIALQFVISAGLIWLPMNNVLYCAIIFILLIVVYVAFIKRFYHLYGLATKKITKE